MSVLDEWRTIPGVVEAAVARGRLDEPAADGRTPREVVHHVVEANVVAASIVVAALGSPGCTYDWSWMQPFGPWMDRLAYRTKPVEQALALLRALNAYLVMQIEPLPDALERRVFLRDAPDAEPRRVTVADVLRQEIEHAREELSGG